MRQFARHTGQFWKYRVWQLSFAAAVAYPSPRLHPDRRSRSKVTRNVGAAEPGEPHAFRRTHWLLYDGTFRSGTIDAD